MSNLYNQFVMKGPSKNALAQRLLGAPGPTTGVAVPIRKSSSTKDFFNRLQRPHAVPGGNPYYMGSNGGLNGLLGLGAVDANIGLVEGVSFMFDIDKKDFISDRPIHKLGVQKLGLRWDAVTPAQVTAVGNKLADMRSTSETGAAIAADLTSRGNDLAQQIGIVGEKVEWEAFGLGARGEVDVFGKVLRDQPERNRIIAMNALKAWMNEVMAAPMPPPDTTGSGGSADTRKKLLKNKIDTLNQPAQQQAPASSGFSPMMLAGGFAALAVTLIVVKKLKKK